MNDQNIPAGHVAGIVILVCAFLLLPLLYLDGRAAFLGADALAKLVIIGGVAGALGLASRWMTERSWSQWFLALLWA